MWSQGHSDYYFNCQCLTGTCDQLYIRGIWDDDKTDTLSIRTDTVEKAEELKNKLQTALDEFVWMNKQEESVTRLDVFKALLPNVHTDGRGVPIRLPCDADDSIYNVTECGKTTCLDCRKAFWNAPAPEKFQKKEDK